MTFLHIALPKSKNEAILACMVTRTPTFKLLWLFVLISISSPLYAEVMSVEKQIVELQKEIRQLPDYREEKNLNLTPLQERTREFQAVSKSWFLGLNRRVKNGEPTGKIEEIHTQQIMSMARQLALRHHQAKKRLDSRLKSLKHSPLHLSNLSNTKTVQLFNGSVEDQGLNSEELKWLNLQSLFYQTYGKIAEQILNSKALHPFLSQMIQNLPHFKRSTEEVVALASESFSRRNREKFGMFKQRFLQHHIIETTLFMSPRKSLDLMVERKNSIETIKRLLKETSEGRELSTISRLTYELSQVFGNAAGAIKWRKGHLLNDTATHDQLKKTLEPFDILLERTPFALTDYLIPGHFSHAAMWLGTPEQLKSRGLWELPILDGFRDEIRNGKRIIEAVRPGVRLNTLKGFMSVDEVAVVRYRDIRNSRKQQKKILNIAINQHGKDYDFNFDVSTSQYIVCSELVYQAFWMINWPTDHVLGRETISPDHLGELAFYRNSPIEFITYITAENKNRGEERSMSEMAKLFNFTPNKNGHFDKVETICERKQWSRLRVGSRRRRHIHINQCHQETAPLNYTPLSN